MANNVPRDAEKNGSWQLLGEMRIDKVDNNVQQLTEQISGAVRKLSIQALQLDRILNALLGVIQKATLIRNRDQEISPILLRIWAEKDCVSGRGWGFFVVEQPFNHFQDMAGLTMYLVELFLYQE